MNRRNHILLACLIVSATTILSNRVYAEQNENELLSAEFPQASLDVTRNETASSTSTNNTVTQPQDDVKSVDESDSAKSTEQLVKDDIVNSGQDEEETASTLSIGHAALRFATTASQSSSKSSDIVVERAWGETRSKTANDMALKYFRSATRVVLANHFAYSDAMSATNITDGKAPILYTDRDWIMKSTVQTIERINPREIFLMGGERVISKKVENFFRNKKYRVIRVAGETEFDTNIASLKYSSKKNIVLATGMDYSDGLAVSPYAQQKNANIILTRTNSLHPTTEKYLKSKKGKISSLTVAGGPIAISNGVVRRSENLLGAKGSRVYGESRYETAVRIAEKMDTRRLIFATGINSADAMVAAPYAQKYGTPIILMGENRIPQSSMKFLSQRNGNVDKIVIVGGRDVISDKMKEDALNLLKEKKEQNTRQFVDIGIFIPKDFVHSTNSLSLYAEKNENSSVVVKVPKNALVRVVEVTEDGWVLLSYNHKRGYSLPINSKKFEAKNDPNIFAKGVDVSRYNYVNDFVTAKKDGIDFIIARAGSGANGGYIDPYFERNYKDAKAAGLSVGAYWYTYAMTVDDAVREADMFISALRGKKFEYPVYLDFEDPSQSRLTKKEKTDIAVAFMNRLEKKGYYTGLYSMGSWLNGAFENDRIKDYDKWIAHWGVDAPTAVDSYGMWQYTNAGQVKGIRKAGAEMDVNFSYINYPAIMKRLKLNNF